ncbi:hypothetical protein Z517_03491 [Fonsecaea pedrosoi CBS 271.37]|uniref:DUF7924 domain-containing protein n=1 Tax=Fonsecaea pedrosoi CBS 271.37 TaxID=1442368 RepID=A0A0D2E2D9_9EURO|nr:uncharacterized protein Z517_03491 [Fonsecaea pedrosoi CBS 271.37]KIW84241.1 hypothetical protein Z517_03491 [Fonsecaea pedrosoi CBS 271.37]
MPPKRSSKAQSSSRRAKNLVSQSVTAPQASENVPAAVRQPQKLARKQRKPDNIQKPEVQGPEVQRTQRHTRRSQTLPLLEKRDDIDTVTWKRKRRPAKSSLVAESPSPGESLVAEQQAHQTTNVVPSIDQQNSPIESASAGQQEQLGFDLLSADLQTEETLSLRSSTESETTTWLRDPPDAETVFLQRNGYTTELSDDALAAIQVVLGKEAAIKMAGIRSDSLEFRKTLGVDRNVLSNETKWDDPEWAHLQSYQPTLDSEDDPITGFLDRLWLADLGFCKNQQEAIFQRTVMMAMINRHRLIFAGDKIATASPLMFSVEASWTCPPMPTRKYYRQNEGNPFAKMPRPDLCVSFRRTEILDPDFWTTLLPTTQELICYEGIRDLNNEAARAFGFFFVEAKRSRLWPDDETALNQALNDASQALHNIYEFFREAGQTTEFFLRVRVFSATASEKGVIIRAHWACELTENTNVSKARIDPKYPLQFRHQIYQSFMGDGFDRLKVVEAFERIMVGYGQEQLLPLLKTAAKSVRVKASEAYENRGRKPWESFFNDYRYGQSGKPGSRMTSRLPTPAGGSSPRHDPTPKDTMSMRDTFTFSTTRREYQQDPESTSLSQGVEALQTTSFYSQRSTSSRNQDRGPMATEYDNTPSKKRKIGTTKT